MKKTLLTLSAIALLAGCQAPVNSGVTRADFDALRADVAAAKTASQQAYQAAQQANMNAQEAKNMAMSTRSSLNGMFKNSQMK